MGNVSSKWPGYEITLNHFETEIGTKLESKTNATNLWVMHESKNRKPSRCDRYTHALADDKKIKSWKNSWFPNNNKNSRLPSSVCLAKPNRTMMQHRWAKMTSTGMEQQQFRTWVDENKRIRNRSGKRCKRRFLQKTITNFFKSFQTNFICDLREEKNKNIFRQTNVFSD